MHGTSNLLGTGSVTVYLFEPGTACDTSGDGAVDSWTFSNVSGNGPFDTSTTDKGGFVSDQAGVYHFVAVFSGDTNNPGPVDSGCTSEPVTVTASPSITTDQTPKTGSLGDTLNDSATLHGTSNLLGTGSVTVYLFEPGTACDTSGDGAVDSWTFSNVSGNGPFDTSTTDKGGFVSDQAGVYHFVAVFSGDTNNPGPVDSGCTSEPVTVTASPSITTDQTPKTGSLGDTLNDSATLHGTSNLLGTGSVTVYLFEPGTACDTSGDGAVDSWTFSNVSGNGPFDTSTTDKGGFVSDQAGVYHFVAVFSGDTNNPGPVDSGCTSEPVTVTASPSITTDQTPKTGSLGDTLNDSATLHGTSNLLGTGSVTVYLFEPGTACDTSGDGAVDSWTFSNVSGNGPFDTSTTDKGGFVSDQAGVYHFVAVFSGDTNNPGPVDSGCTSEPVTVTASPSITTDQTPKTGSLGDTLNDSATLHGTSNLLGTGSVTVYLFEPGTACDTSGDGAVDSWTFSNVSGNGPFDTSTTDKGGFVSDQAGVYHFVAVFSGDTNNPGPVDSGCTSEPVVISPAALQIVKTADKPEVNVGEPIGFTLTVYNTGSGDARGVNLSDTLPTNPGLSWSIDKTGAGWGESGCAIAAGVLSCGPATVPAGTTQAASTFTVHITSQTTGATGGDCPTTGVVDNTGAVTARNAVSDQASASTCVQALVDLSITKSGSPATQTLGDGNITWTMVVTNNGPSADTGVTIADPMPAGNTFVSAAASKGTCTGGAILNCTIGNMAVGETVTITLVTTPSTVGAQANTVNVVGNRPETNTANNTATATVQTVGVITPPVFCVAVSRVTPKQLFVGRKTMLTIHLTQDKKAVSGVHVRIKGPKLNIKTKASNARGVVKQTVKMKKAGVLIFTPIASKACNTKRVGVTNVFTPPVTG